MGTPPDGTGVLIQPVRQMLQIDRFLFRWGRFFDRDDVHADAGVSGLHHGRDLFQRQAGHPLEHRRHFRVRRDRVQIHIHIFCAAGYEHGQHVLLVMIFVFPVVFDHAAQSQLFQQFLRARKRFAALFGDFCCRDWHTLVHDDGDFFHFIRHDVFRPQILRRFLRYLFQPQRDRHAVRDLFAQKLQCLSFSHVLPSLIDFPVDCL